MNTTLNLPFARIEELEARVKELESALLDSCAGHAAIYENWYKQCDRIKELEAALRRCQTVLGNMTLENEGAIFNRWPINHEPLRNDARNLLPVIDAALDQDAGT